MNNEKFFKFFFGCSPSDFSQTVIITPFIPLKRFKEYGNATEDFKGKLYSSVTISGNKKKVTVLCCGMGSQFTGDAILLLGQTPVERIVFINDIKRMAVDEVKKEAFDELDNYDFDSETEFDDDDLERLRVYDDDDDILVDDVDFDDKDADVYVEFKFEHDEVKYEARALVEFRDGEVDDFDIDEVWLKD